MTREERILKKNTEADGGLYYDTALRSMREFAKKDPLPPAEGAEAILRQPKYNSLKNLGLICEAMEEFATLHAQRIADKMVSERLREELIAFDLFSNVSETPPHDDEDIEVAIKAAEKYLKSKKHG